MNTGRKKVTVVSKLTQPSSHLTTYFLCFYAETGINFLLNMNDAQ